MNRMSREHWEVWLELLGKLKQGAPRDADLKELAAFLRRHPECTDGLVLLADDPDGQVRLNAIRAMGFCGRELLEACPEAEAKLLQRIKQRLKHIKGWRDDECCRCVLALGSVGVSERSVSLLLRLTDPPDGELAGPALTALGSMGIDPDRVVPRLVKLLDQFKEHEPDWGSSHSRVIEALRAFGPHGSAAVPALLPKIWPTNPDGERALEVDREVVTLLGSFGPAAKTALPELLNARDQYVRWGGVVEDLDPTSDGENEYCPSFLIEAIRQIQGA